jgi:hypothetical protein
MPEILALMIPIVALCIPIVAIVTAHQRKLIEMRMGSAQFDRGLAEEVRKLQEQVAELRDTTTRYDLSFDTALQRIEGRVSAVEQNVAAIQGERQSASRSAIRGDG